MTFRDRLPSQGVLVAQGALAVVLAGSAATAVLLWHGYRHAAEYGGAIGAFALWGASAVALFSFATLAAVQTWVRASARFVRLERSVRRTVAVTLGVSVLILSAALFFPVFLNALETDPAGIFRGDGRIAWLAPRWVFRVFLSAPVFLAVTGMLVHRVVVLAAPLQEALEEHDATDRLAEVARLGWLEAIVFAVATVEVFSVVNLVRLVIQPIGWNPETVRSITLGAGLGLSLLLAIPNAVVRAYLGPRAGRMGRPGDSARGGDALAGLVETLKAILPLLAAFLSVAIGKD